MPSQPEDAVAMLRRVGDGLARLEREQVCCGQVTPHQFGTLRLLHEAGGLSTSELASRLRIDLSTASRNLAVLEREGCIRRRPAPEDARRVQNQVTAKGRACIEDLCCDEQAAFRAVLDRLSSADRKEVVRVLPSLVSALESFAEACCASGPVPASSARARRASRNKTRSPRSRTESLR